MARAKKPKVEFLYDYSLCGERVKGGDFVDEMITAVGIGKEYPDAETIYIDNVDCDDWTVDFFVIYRKLTKRVSLDEVEAAFRQMIAERE